MSSPRAGRRASPTASTTQKAIVEGGKVVGFVASFMREGQLEVTYWIARSHWGRGVATAALLQLLQRVTATSAIYAKRSEGQRRVASRARENVASISPRLGQGVCERARRGD